MRETGNDCAALGAGPLVRSERGYLKADEALVALGANLGEREENLAGAVAGLAQHAACEVLAVSPYFATAPVGGPPDQGEFLNAAVLLRTTLQPEQLLELLHSIEANHGRHRLVPNGPRTLDLDLLVFGRESREGPGLELPHPRMHERLFVLDPVACLCPQLQLTRADRKTVHARQTELRSTAR